MDPASHTPLALPEQAASAKMPAAPAPITVTGKDPQTVAAVESALRDPILTHAIEIAFSGLATQVEVTATRARTSSCVQRGTTISFEHKSTGPKIIDEFAKEVFRQASREMLLITTGSFVRMGALAESHLRDLKTFLGLAFTVPVSTDAELQQAIAILLKECGATLEKTRDQIIKKLEKTARAHFDSADEARLKIEQSGDLTRAALTISLLMESREDRSRTIDRLMKTVSVAQSAVEALWRKNLFSGDAPEIKKNIELFSFLQSAFHTPGFNAHKPRIFPDKEPRSTVSVAATLANTLTDMPRLGSQGRPFRPQGSSNIDEVTRESNATFALDQELRAWKVEDDDVAGFLNERILDLIPQLPQAIAALERDKPSRIPEELSTFIQCLCLLRLHGGTNGLVHFGLLACQLTPDEKANFMNDPQRYVAAHPDDYAVLVEFLATWPLKTSEYSRILVCDAILPRLRILATSEIYNLTKSFENSSLQAIAKQTELTGQFARAFLADVRGVGRAAKAIGSPELLAYALPITGAIRRFLLTRIVENLPLERRLAHIDTLDRLLAQQQTEVAERPQVSGLMAELLRPQITFVGAVVNYIDGTRGRLVEELDEFARQLEREFSVLFEAGDVVEFNRLLKQASQLIPLVRNREIAAQAASATDVACLRLINLIREAATVGLGEGEARLRKEPSRFLATQTLLEAALEYLKPLHDLRDTLARTTLENRFARINHLDTVINFIRKSSATILTQNQEAFSQYLNEVTSLIKRNAASDDARAIATVALSLPVSLKDLKHNCREAYRAFEVAVVAGKRKT